MSPGPAGAAPSKPPRTILPGETVREPILTRREFVRNTVRLAVAGAVLPGTLSQVLPAIAPSALAGAGAGPVIRRDPVTNAKIPIKVSDLAPQPSNQPVVGEWGFLPAIVYMVKKEILEKSSLARGVNTAQFAVQHPTEPSYAILVYRGKCKHLGCTVGWNGLLGGSKDIEDYNGDGISEGRILCPCHQGQYDIYDLALNVPGTPPPAPLDVVRIRVGSFSDPTGRIPSEPEAIIGSEVLVQSKYRDADLDGKAGKTAFALGSQAATGA